ncbi:MAG: type II toxin-antitoxin system VapC family toxin [Candidatus Dormibacteria bacterium]
MIYLDSSAVVKLVRLETSTIELVDWLSSRPGASLVSSALVEVEVPRALRRHAPSAMSGVPGVLARLYRLEVDWAVRATAAAYQDPSLRSPDAVHLATAQLVGAEDPVEAFVAYDTRLLAAAEALGLAVASPGLS